MELKEIRKMLYKLDNDWRLAKSEKEKNAIDEQIKKYEKMEKDENDNYLKKENEKDKLFDKLFGKLIGKDDEDIEDYE